ncbi:O-linked N-acetylglucosamine transferase family protein [Bradyrhizobium commune]|uniref:protein O-GlcNAc transferase n=1 Tax=Bradyrhizobium commune TaxID=83627 RepID=A0A7S9GYT9_9BRAD|nr:tetratricopeptide repeat protein [Bradyrhizobium commune]QPF89920.1 tetratricopeptide repeat protein [Bradyrhizobium commune]
MKIDDPRQLLHSAMQHFHAGQLEQADFLCRTALKGHNSADGWHLLGMIALRSGRIEEAASCLKKCTKRQPDNPAALCSLGIAYKALGRLSEAATAFEQAARADPRSSQILYNLGNARTASGEFKAAITAYRQALTLDPSRPEYHTNLIFALNFDPAAGPEDHQRERLSYGDMQRAQTAPAPAAESRPYDPERRLRVGYVSAHFRHQAATYAFAPVIINHDPTAFDVVCYSDTAIEDDLTRRLRGHVKTWRATATLSDAELIALIRADDIDILVDLVGHMVGNRLEVFARKPAPVQVTGWGEPTGTGLTTMDYLLADPVLVPPDMRFRLREEVIDLPCFLSFWTPEPLPDPGPLPALAAGHVTFGSFNRPEKLSDPVLRLWAAMLRALPNARLVLKSSSFGNAAHQQRIRSVFQREGIKSSRLTILGDTDRDAHMLAYRTVDVALDPFPHGGGMTTLDAIAMGIPVITCPGPTISSRLAAACVTAVGLPDWVAPNHDDYVALAARMTTDLDGLARLRGSLRDRLMRSSVGDTRSYAHAVEAAYRDMWRRCCARAQDSGLEVS